MVGLVKERGVKAIFIPDLEADIFPEVSAAGFCLGDSLSSVMKLIGPVPLYESNADIHARLRENVGWMGVRKKLGLNGGDVVTFTYMNGLVILAFECSETLYRIVVGPGYHGRFHDVGVGDYLLRLDEEFDLDFNDVDDEFLIVQNGSYVNGISFITDCRASLIHVPDQIIERISVHNWALR